jgi:dTDP-glucose 4,6-dehydratase
LYRIVPRTVLAALSGQKLKLDGGGKSVRVFIHMRDVSDATLKVARGGQLGESYHISGYRLVSIRELVEMILAALGKSFEECVEIGPDRTGKDSAYTLDSVKIRTALGWQDRITLEEGIEDVIRWAQRFGPALSDLPIRYEHKP